jgi:hypothetical protein
MKAPLNDDHQDSKKVFTRLVLGRKCLAHAHLKDYLFLD